MNIVPTKCEICQEAVYLPHASSGTGPVIFALVRGAAVQCSRCGAQVHYFCLSGGVLIKKKPYVCKRCAQKAA